MTRRSLSSETWGRVLTVHCRETAPAHRAIRVPWLGIGGALALALAIILLGVR